jgi:hypothetical protein
LRRLCRNSAKSLHSANSSSEWIRSGVAGMEDNDLTDNFIVLLGSACFHYIATARLHYLFQ